MKKWIFFGIIFFLVLVVLFAMFYKVAPYDYEVKSSSIFTFKGENVETWAKNFDITNPPELTIYVNHCEYGEDPIVVTDKKTINEVFLALNKIELTGRKNNISSTGTTISYSFKNDKEHTSFSFQDNKIPTDKGQYYIKGYETLNETYYKIREERGLNHE